MEVLGRTTATTRRSLLVTRDPELLDDLLRITAAAGVEAEVAADAAAARRAWSGAAAVVVGSDLLPACAAAGVPRRDGTVVVGLDLDDAEIWRQALDVGADHVVFLPDAEEWITDLLADAVEGVAAPGRLVAVLGGRGGAGATTLAAALAVTAARTGHQVLLVDGDPFGGGVDMVLGAEDVPGLRWPDLARSQGRVASAALAAALPERHGVRMLSWVRGECVDVPRDAVATLLTAGLRGHDLVVADLSRHLDAAAIELLQRADRGLVVLPAEVRACAAASAVVALAARHCRDLQLVVRGPAPAGLTAEAVARSVGLPLAGRLGREHGLAGALERGDPPARRGRGPLAEFCADLLDELVPAPADRRPAA